MGLVINATPGKDPGTQCIGGWVGLRASLDGCGKPRPHRDLIPGLSSPKGVAKPTTLCRLLASGYCQFNL
jgi:hypothetical protein